VQYQARYQTVVTNLRARDALTAQRNLEDFKKWIPKANTDALLSADMLTYRVALAVADARGDPVEKRQGRKNALDAMAAIMQRDPRYRDLVYDQIALLIPENAELGGLLPLQQLAVARSASVNQDGTTEDSRRMLQRAVTAAQAARSNAQATRVDKSEATFLLGVGHALLGELPEAVQFEVDFASMAPGDTRARQMIDLALQQIGELRKQAPATTQATGTGAAIGAAASTLSPEMRALAERALEISTKTFGDRQWLYAQGRLLEESGKGAEAAAVYEGIKPEERTYLEARYRLVALAAERFGALEGKPEEQAQAATELFAVCTKFSDVLEHPPAATPKEVVQAAKAYQYNIWLLEAATAVSPGVKNAQVALDRVTKLDAARGQLSEGQRTAVLQYRMQAYLLAGQQEQAAAALEEFAKSGGGLAVVRGMALATVDEIDKMNPPDPQQVKKLSSYVVMLLGPLIRQATAEGKTDSAFEYRLIQADMMVKTGQYKEAETLATTLQGEKPTDIRAFLAEARAVFAEAQEAAPADAKLFAKAQDYYTRLLGSPRMQVGSESFWEAWLRVIQAMEAQGVAGAGEIKSRLGDFKAVYGGKFGGERYAGEFRKLAERYEVK